MKILGLDSSGLVASVAVVEDDTLLSEYTVNHKKTHSQTLLPMLDEIVRRRDRVPSQVCESGRQLRRDWDLLWISH